MPSIYPAKSTYSKALNDMVDWWRSRVGEPGTMFGPESTTLNAVVRWGDLIGVLTKDSDAILSDAGAFAVSGAITQAGLNVLDTGDIGVSVQAYSSVLDELASEVYAVPSGWSAVANPWNILTETTDTLSVARGGTGAVSLTGMLFGAGTSAISVVTSSTTGQTLRCTGANTFAFGALDLGNAAAVTGVLPDSNVADNLTISGGTINNTPIGESVRSTIKGTTGDFNSTLNVTGAVTTASSITQTGDSVESLHALYSYHNDLAAVRQHGVVRFFAAGGTLASPLVLPTGANAGRHASFAWTGSAWRRQGSTGWISQGSNDSYWYVYVNSGSDTDLQCIEAYPDQSVKFFGNVEITGTVTNDDIHSAVTLAGSLDYITLSGQEITRNAIDLTTDVTGILPTANGGTGIAYFTAAGPTQARVYTFPDAAETIATLGQTQTFTGSKTFSATLSVAAITASGLVTANGDSGISVSRTTTGSSLLSVTGVRRSAAYNNAVIRLDAPRSDTADNSTVSGRGYIVLSGDSATSAANVFIGANSANAVTTGDGAAIVAGNQSLINIRSGGEVYFYKNGTAYASFSNTAVSFGSSILGSANGGTANAFFAVSGPASSTKTYTFPNASDTVGCLGTIQTWSAAQTFTADTAIGGNAVAAQRLLTLNTASGNNRYVRISSGGVVRWQIGGSSAAESGSDAGTPFAIAAYTDAGAFIDIPLVINRVAGGAVVLVRPLTTNGTITSSATTAAVFNTTATTVNAFGAASVALNIGNAAVQAAFPGGINVASGKVYSVNGTQVVGARGAAITAVGAAYISTDVEDPSDLATILNEFGNAINSLRTRSSDHGLIEA